jgi:hypothetical protein
LISLRAAKKWDFSGTVRLRRKENQKAKISAPGRGPDGGGIFRGWPQSRQSSMTQSSMTQFLSGAGNWPLRGIFAAAREEIGL